MLEQVLVPENILLKRVANDWRHAIEIASQPLLAKQDIEPSYVLAMQDAVVEHGPYMVLGPGLALAHARPGKDVNRVCLSLLTIDPPVNFGNPDFDPVDILIAFGTPDSDSHIEMLRELGKILMDEDNLAVIRASTDPHRLVERWLFEG